MGYDYLGYRIPETLAELTEPASTALLVIDMQNDFVHDEGYCAQQLGVSMVTGFQGVIEPTVRLVAAARSAGIHVVHSRVTQLPDGSLSSPAWIADVMRYGLEPLHCMRDSWGWEFLAELTPQSGDIVIDKPRRSAFHGTNLTALLAARGIRTVVLSGVAGTGCVESTVRDAMERDLFAVVPGDCTANNNAELSAACGPVFRALLGDEGYTTSDVLIALWRGDRR